MNEDEKLVLKSLENPKYDWRTIDGISKETGFPEEKVIKIMETIISFVVKSSVPSREGKSLFTSRSRFRKKYSFFKQFHGAVKNRAS